MLIDRDLLARLYLEEGLTDRQIAALLGVRAQTINKARHECGIPTIPRAARTRLTPDVLRRLYEEDHLTDSEIGKLYGYCAAWVSELRARFGIKTIRKPPKTRKLTEALLRRHYLIEHLTIKQIAARYGLDRSTIIKYLRTFGIPKVRPSERRSRHSLFRCRRALEVLMGTVLGDGHLNRMAPHTVRLEIKHAASQAEWLAHKVKLMTPPLEFRIDRIRTKTGFKGQPQYRAISRSHPDLARVYSWFYDPATERKILTEECLRRLTPRVIATWLLDDGSRQKSGRYVLYSQCFSREENERLAVRLIEFGLNPEVVSYKPGKFHLAFSKADGEVLAAWIEKYYGCVATMRYKAGLPSQVALPI